MGGESELGVLYEKLLNYYVFALCRYYLLWLGLVSYSAMMESEFNM